MKQGTILATVVATAFSVTLVGCAHHKSNKVKGEVVRLELKTNNVSASGTVSTMATGLEAAAAGALVGVAIDLAKAKIEAEANKLERQYGQFDYRSDFWKITRRQASEPVGLIPQYAGFTLKRFTKDWPEAAASSNGPAMLFECQFERSTNGRMFLIKPIAFTMKQAKAKIVNSDAKVNVSVNVAVDALWIDGAQVAHQERIAFSTFEIMDYDLSRSRTLTVNDFGGQRAGWFPGVPVSREMTGKFSWETATNTLSFIDGCFKLSVLVTERDASKAKQHLEKAAKFIGDQKDKLVEKAKEAAGD